MQHGQLDNVDPEQSGHNVDEASVTDQLEADICPLCLDVFYEALDLLEHVFDSHFVTSSNNYECSRCLDISDLSLGKCDICQGWKFEDPRDLLKHTFQDHQVSLERTCLTCLDIFSDLQRFLPQVQSKKSSQKVELPKSKITEVPSPTIGKFKSCLNTDKNDPDFTKQDSVFDGTDEEIETILLNASTSTEKNGIDSCETKKGESFDLEAMDDSTSEIEILGGSNQNVSFQSVREFDEFEDYVKRIIKKENKSSSETD